jgi:hypothetical protein
MNVYIEAAIRCRAKHLGAAVRHNYPSAGAAHWTSYLESGNNTSVRKVIMSCRKTLLTICFFIFFIAFDAVAQDNPAEMFVELFERYLKTEYKTVVISRQSEGGGMFIFDVNQKMSKDIFRQINFYSSLGKTQYLVYKKDGEDIWYFHKKAYFYESSFKLENARIENTYFRYSNNMPYAFNEATGKYDIQADTNQYPAIRDVRSLARLIEIVQEYSDTKLYPR